MARGFVYLVLDWATRRVTGALAGNGIAISMDGKGAGQRVRRAVMAQRQVRGGVLRAYDSVGEARSSNGRYLDFYDGRRPHSSLGDWIAFLLAIDGSIGARGRNFPMSQPACEPDFTRHDRAEVQ